MLLRISRLPSDEPAHGLDLGHFYFEGPEGEARSDTPNRSSMIYIAICDLLNGLRPVISDEKREFEFVAADSSFGLVFRRIAPGMIEVRCGKRVLGVVDKIALWQSVSEGVEQFLTAPDNVLAADDPGRWDLDKAWCRFRALF